MLTLYHFEFMRIAILTIPLNANYGGILQAYALQTTLENLGGHDVVVLDNPYLLKMPPKFLRPFVYAARLIGRKLGMYHGNIKKEVARIHIAPIHIASFMRISMSTLSMV